MANAETSVQLILYGGIALLILLAIVIGIQIYIDNTIHAQVDYLRNEVIRDRDTLIELKTRHEAFVHFLGYTKTNTQATYRKMKDE